MNAVNLFKKNVNSYFNLFNIKLAYLYKLVAIFLDFVLAFLDGGDLVAPYNCYFCDNDGIKIYWFKTGKKKNYNISSPFHKEYLDLLPQPLCPCLA